MDVIVGKYVLQRMENQEAMMKALDVSRETMQAMNGPSGLVFEVMINGDKITMNRSDGKNATFKNGEELETYMNDKVVKMMPKVEGNVISFNVTLADGRTFVRKYIFATDTLIMEMMFKDVTMKVHYRRM